MPPSKKKQEIQNQPEEQAPLNEFDRAIKENLSAVTDPFMMRILGLNPDIIRKLPTEIQRTLEWRLDEVNLAIEDGEEYIMHFEYQRKNQADMLGRMIEYWGILYRKYKKKILQAVLYLGDEPMDMENEYRDAQVSFHFELKDIKSISARSLIASPYPEEVVMAVMGNYEGEAPEVVISDIFKRLKVLAKTDVDFQKYEERLLILAKSRNFW